MFEENVDFLDFIELRLIQGENGVKIDTEDLREQLRVAIKSNLKINTDISVIKIVNLLSQALSKNGYSMLDIENIGEIVSTVKGVFREFELKWHH